MNNIDPNCAAGVDCEGCRETVYCPQRDTKRKTARQSPLPFINIDGDKLPISPTVEHIITCALRVAVEQYRKDSETCKGSEPLPAVNLVIEPPHALVKGGNCSGCDTYPVILYKVPGQFERYRCDACYIKETGARHPLAVTAIRETIPCSLSLVEAFARQADLAQQVLDTIGEEGIYHALTRAVYG